jgi:hypothetical protein
LSLVHWSHNYLYLMIVAKSHRIMLLSAKMGLLFDDTTYLVFCFHLRFQILYKVVIVLEKGQVKSTYPILASVWWGIWWKSKRRVCVKVAAHGPHATAPNAATRSQKRLQGSWRARQPLVACGRHWRSVVDWGKCRRTRATRHSHKRRHKKSVSPHTGHTPQPQEARSGFKVAEARDSRLWLVVDTCGRWLIVGWWSIG